MCAGCCGSTPFDVMLDANLSPFAFVGRGHQFAVGFPCFLVGLGSFLDVWTECTLMFVGFWERDGMEEGKLFLVTMAAAASFGGGAPAVPAATVAFSMYIWTVPGCRLAFRVIPLSSGGPPW